MSTPVLEPRTATRARGGRLLPAPAPQPPRTETTLQRSAPLHLFTYIVGNALFWVSWAAIGISADHWYWWPVVPLVGWAAVLAIHLAVARRDRRRAAPDGSDRAIHLP